MELQKAKLETLILKPDLQSLLLALEGKDTQLVDAKMELSKVKKEVAELRMLMNRTKAHLLRATISLKKRKEEQVQVMHKEMSGARLMELTKEASTTFLHQTVHRLTTASFVSGTRQLETELNSIRESLREKELEILAADRGLTVKDKEMEAAVERLYSREKDLKQQERKRMGDLAIEKLQLEATRELQLTEISRELLDTDDKPVFLQDDARDEALKKVVMEVTHLAALTEKLVKEAND